MPRRTLRIALLALIAISVTACTHTIQAWPPPLEHGNWVLVEFAAPRALSLHRGGNPDSAVTVNDVRGRVVDFRRDTLVLDVATIGLTRMDESRRTSIELDRGTIVTRSEVNGWFVGYAILGGAVLIFAVMALRGT